MLSTATPARIPLIPSGNTGVASPPDLIPQGSTIVYYTPSQIQTAYGFNKVSVGGFSLTPANYNATAGAGETIAIVDAYDDPNIASDLVGFDTYFGLPGTNASVPGTTNSVFNFFTKVNEYGGTNYPAVSVGWSREIALDVEWIHAMAPQAKILLVEATSDLLPDLYQAASFAASQPGVVAVSMSFGSSDYAGETASDFNFTTPLGHQGVVFVASTGDYPNSGAPAYPAFSPNVLAVGGTSLTLNPNNSIASETTWNDALGGSLGGVSSIEAEPAYQEGVQQTGFRTIPDVSLNADPNTGYPVYDTTYNPVPGDPWEELGGTSASGPIWSALVAIIDQATRNPGQSHPRRRQPASSRDLQHSRRRRRHQPRFPRHHHGHQCQWRNGRPWLRRSHRPGHAGGQ